MTDEYMSEAQISFSTQAKQRSILNFVQPDDKKQIKYK